jgi:aspartyl-tRNA(Asn)/glutamyl-tRNA(Gln) amidotransferase subunit B
MKYEAVIGLEVHAQLLTHSKVFCSCSTLFGAGQNTRTCPVCTGMPGVLPVLNRKAVELTIRAALASNCSIARRSRFARKNYFYPDLPKGYQISQYDEPLALGGYLDIEVNGQCKRVGITRIHLEEDAGKLIHGENVKDPARSYLDFNRCGVPLIEIVSEPDMRSSEEAKAYLTELKTMLQYLEVCDGNMEEGSLRCDANISLRPEGSSELGVKTEIKNMNSFRNVQNALDYEIKRQTRLLEAGERIVQETRLWDAAGNETHPMRSKEEAHDYRYFPEPDLVLTEVSDEWIEEIKESLPEMRDQKKARFIGEYGIPEYDASVLTLSKPLADFFEKCVEGFRQPKTVSNWLMGDFLRELNNQNIDADQSPIGPEHVVGMLKLIDQGVISGKIAKTVFEEMFSSGEHAEAIVKRKGLIQITDEDELESVVETVMAENPDEVEAYRGGKDKLLGFFVGQVMKATGGKANPGLANRILKEKLRAD